MVDQGKQSIISANIESGKVHTLSSGSIYVKIIVFIMDFLILNGIMWLAFVFFRDLVPPYIDKATRVTILVMNFTMLIAQYFFHTIINRHLLKLKDMLVNVLCLVLLQVSSMGLMLRFLAGSTNSGNLFRFVVIFGAAEFLTIFLSRLIEARLASLYACQWQELTLGIVCGQRSRSGCSLQSFCGVVERWLPCGGLLRRYAYDAGAGRLKVPWNGG